MLHITCYMLHMTCSQTNHCLPEHSHRKKVLVYDLRSHNIDCLRYNLGTFPWQHLMQFNDVEVVYQQFVSIVHNIVLQSVPTKTVKLGPKDAPFVTPIVKRPSR